MVLRRKDEGASIEGYCNIGDSARQLEACPFIPFRACPELVEGMQWKARALMPSCDMAARSPAERDLRAGSYRSHPGGSTRAPPLGPYLHLHCKCRCVGVAQMYGRRTVLNLFSVGE